MAEINIERKGDSGSNSDNGNNGNKGSSKWWVWVVVAILAILIAWMALSDRNEVEGEETRQEEFTPGMDEDTRIEPTN